MQRKFRRNQLRKIVGNKNGNLASLWQSTQMEKYGEDYHKICRGFSRRNK